MLQNLQTETKFQKERLVKYTRSHALLNSKLVIAILSPGYLDAKSSYINECDTFTKCKKFLVIRKEETSPLTLPACVVGKGKNLRSCGEINDHTENFEPFCLGSPEYESFLDELANDIIKNLDQRT